jgi:3-oxoacyl-[acyl-carrier-protein] synthase III
MAQHWSDPTALEVLGMGTALPGDPIDTARLLAAFEPWLGSTMADRGLAIARKLGIATRHLCRPMAEALEPPRPGQRNPQLAAVAVRAALREADLRAHDLAYLIGHTATPARHLPPNIGEVASLLGYDGPFVEFRQACTGFANALVFAQGLLRAGADPVAIVGSETGSVFFDPRRVAHERGQLVNLVQMGDGAAAIVLGRKEGRSPHLLSRVFYGQAGRGRGPGLSLTHGGSDAPACPLGFPEFAHDFAAIRRGGPDLLRRCARAAERVGAAPADRVLPHQANGRMDKILAPLLGLTPERIVVNADRLGNTGSAAIWLALAELRLRLPTGETVVALGAEATDFMFGGFRYAHG